MEEMFPEVREGVGERPAPVWRVARRPHLRAEGLGFMLGTEECGGPHLERIAAWAKSAAMEHGKAFNRLSGEEVIGLYLSSEERFRDHAAWLWDCLVALHAVPADADNLDFQAHMLAETNQGWLRSAPRHLGRVLKRAMPVEAFIAERLNPIASGRGWQ